jgi:alkanesulfonate monooxygenase SsuD/methylene tetrahydromethanopterin reductase-like flavin-dependent oxidoreductase (luciferase family)
MEAMAFFGYHMPSFTFPGVPPDQLFDHAAGLARSAENAGFELVTVMDHFYQITPIGKEEEPMPIRLWGRSLGRRAAYAWQRS